MVNTRPLRVLFLLHRYYIIVQFYLCVHNNNSMFLLVHNSKILYQKIPNDTYYSILNDTSMWTLSYCTLFPSYPYCLLFVTYLDHSKSIFTYTDGTYEEEYSCWPPAVCMIIISLVEIILFCYDAAKGHTDANGTIAKLFIYNPHKRHEAWRFITYMLVHVG